MQVALEVREACEPAANVFANEYIAEAALEEAELSVSAACPAEASSTKEAGDRPVMLRSRAAALFEENATYDVVRAGFWRWRAAQCGL